MKTDAVDTVLTGIVGASVRATCELLSHNHLLAAGVEFRYGLDFVQVIRNGNVAATFRPSTVDPSAMWTARRELESEL